MVARVNAAAAVSANQDHAKFMRRVRERAVGGEAPGGKMFGETAEANGQNQIKMGYLGVILDRHTPRSTPKRFKRLRKGIVIRKGDKFYSGSRWHNAKIFGAPASHSRYIRRIV